MTARQTALRASHARLVLSALVTTIALAALSLVIESSEAPKVRATGTAQPAPAPSTLAAY